jgi:hypothetical protein
MSKEGSADKTAQGREQVEHLSIKLPYNIQILLQGIAEKRGISLRELLTKEVFPQGLKLYTTAHADEFNRPKAP